MTQTDFLQKEFLLDWSTLFVGFKRKWLGKQDLINFALDSLAKGAEGKFLALMATIDNQLEVEIEDLFIEYFKNNQLIPPDFMDPETIESIKWRWAFLSGILDSDISDEDKINKIQELYAEFNYPDDMQECSPYYIPPEKRENIEIGDRLESPLVSAIRLRNKLLKQIKEGQYKPCK